MSHPEDDTYAEDYWAHRRGDDMSDREQAHLDDRRAAEMYGGAL